VRLLRSPAHYAEYLHEEFKITPALLFGRAVHPAILEPHIFDTEYDVADEDLLIGTLQSLDDYKAAADKLGVSYGVPTKDDLKAAIKKADCDFLYRFRDDAVAEMAAYTQEKLSGTLQSLDDYKAAAAALGIDLKLKKDELKSAIKVADVKAEYRFKEEVGAEMATLTQQNLVATLQSLEEYKKAASNLAVRTEALTKDELKAAIKEADVNSEYRFKEDAFQQLYGEKTILPQEQWEAILKMKHNVLMHKTASHMLSMGKAELSAFWTDPVTGIKCKCRPDWLHENKDEVPVGIVDVKSTLDASISGFARSIGKYGYDIQAAFYVDGVKATIGLTLPFYFLAIEKNGPHAVAMYRASDEMVDTGVIKVVSRERTVSVVSTIRCS
jgi:arsenate reductase-like glutaredoxin family protein